MRLSLKLTTIALIAFTASCQSTPNQRRAIPSHPALSHPIVSDLLKFAEPDVRLPLLALSTDWASQVKLDATQLLAERQQVNASDVTPSSVAAWQTLARDLVAQQNINPPQASRIYALLNLALYEAQAIARQEQIKLLKMVPIAESAKNQAAQAMLAHLIPAAAGSIQTQFDKLQAGDPSFASAKSFGNELGKQVAAELIKIAQADGTNQAWTGTVPTGADKWRSTANPPAPPLLPNWGNARPWFFSSATQLAFTPPPAIDSIEFKNALAEVKAFSDARTPEQLAIAKLWADGAGTATPSGHWNQIATDLTQRNYLNEAQSALVLAILHMSMMDAGIFCWHVKYQTWVLRPSQVEPTITTPVGLPNFPSYTSGHSSFSGAASQVLGHFFPNEQASLDQMADDAAMSRVYGGIHYRFDSEEGLRNGRRIGELAINQWQSKAK